MKRLNGGDEDDEGHEDKSGTAPRTPMRFGRVTKL